MVPLDVTRSITSCTDACACTGRAYGLRRLATEISGNPDPAHVSTRDVERQNLTMRMSIRRFTRLTNAFSKKVENDAAAVSLHFAHYNFCRVHQSLNGQTPAMAAGVTDHVWTLDELIALLEAAERVPVKRGSYRKTRERREAQRAAEVKPAEVSQ